MSSHQTRITVMAITAMLASAALAGPVQAQNVLEEVIVTAQKREQNLQDVPVAVSVFSAATLEQSGVKDMFDLATLAPSLSVNSEQTSTASAFGIRGIFTSSQNFGLESSVGLYVDGVYRARQGSMINNMVDVASVEVLRGPQGTLFGRNTPAGAVLISSARPDFEGTGFLEAGAGDYDLFDLNGAKSLTVVDDVLALRASGFYMERDGTVDAIGREVQEKDSINDRDRWGGRLQALYSPAESVTMHLIADYSEVDEVCCAVGAWKNNFSADADPNKIGSDTRAAGLGGTVPLGSDFYDREVSLSFKPESANEDKGISLQVDWEADFALLTSITAYREHNTNDRVDADFIDIDALVRGNNANQDQFSQELRLSDSLDKISYVAGLYYYRQNLDAVSDTIVGADTATMLGIDDSALPPAFPAGANALNVSEQQHDSYAAFGQADYNLTDALVLTAGLRWTYEEKDMTNTFTEDAAPTPAPTAPGWGLWLFGPLAPRDDVDEKLDDDQLTGTLKLSWFAQDRTMYYASWGTGYKSGGINTDRVTTTVPVVFDPEESESFELGMKSEFPDQALRLNLALHKTDTDDLQTISFQGTGFVLENAGTAETYGAEIELGWLPTATTTATLAYAYNHAEYADFERGPEWTGTPWQTNLPDPQSNGDGTADRSGGDVSSNAENVAALTLNQDIPLGSDLTGFLYGEYIFTDERMTDVNNDPEKRDGSYNLVNLRAGLVFERYATTLTVWGRNVFDEEYTYTIADAVGQFGRFNAFYADPATWGITLRKDF